MSSRIYLSRSTHQPPRRAIDHAINLHQGSVPIANHPYHYPNLQKLEIEKIVNAILRNGIIQPSTSTFSASIVLVKKEDVTWRMCIDYRKLNANTMTQISDSVGQRVLGWATWGNNFFEASLALGISSNPNANRGRAQASIPDTRELIWILRHAFQTHQCQLPFKAWWTLFKPFIQKFGLVFSDELLIDNREDVTHLRTNLQVNALFAKHSKCSLGYWKWNISNTLSRAR